MSANHPDTHTGSNLFPDIFSPSSIAPAEGRGKSNMFSSKIFNLGNAFKQHFEIVPAFSDALKEEVYRVRHQVYCEDLKFEPTPGRIDAKPMTMIQILYIS